MMLAIVNSNSVKIDDIELSHKVYTKLKTCIIFEEEQEYEEPKEYTGVEAFNKLMYISNGTVFSLSDVKEHSAIKVDVENRGVCKSGLKKVVRINVDNRVMFLSEDYCVNVNIKIVA